MLDRPILTVSPQATSWVKQDDQIVVLHHFTRRKVYLDHASAFFWETIYNCSDYEVIEEEFCQKHSHEELITCLKQLERIGLIKIFYDI